MHKYKYRKATDRHGTHLCIYTICRIFGCCVLFFGSVWSLLFFWSVLGGISCCTILCMPPKSLVRFSNWWKSVQAADTLEQVNRFITCAESVVKENRRDSSLPMTQNDPLKQL